MERMEDMKKSKGGGKAKERNKKKKCAAYPRSKIMQQFYDTGCLRVTQHGTYF
jgi:hypothetical protein